MESASWKHPFYPDDVLTDPDTIPDIKTESSISEQEETKAGRPSRWSKGRSMRIDYLDGKGDAQILDEVRKTLKTSEGKRFEG